MIYAYADRILIVGEKMKNNHRTYTLPYRPVNPRGPIKYYAVCQDCNWGSPITDFGTASINAKHHMTLAPLRDRELMHFRGGDLR